MILKVQIPVNFIYFSVLPFVWVVNYMDDSKKIFVIVIEILFALSILSLASYEVKGELWRNETIGNGTYSSIEIDSFGNPRVVYYDNKKGNLVYARLTKTGWEYEVVDSDKNVGKYNSLVLDEKNIPHISYYDTDNGNLKYARLFNDKWKIKTVQKDGNVGKFSSITLDGKENSHISYYDSSNGNLMHARKGAELWNTETVDSEGDVGKYTSIGVGNNIHISYYSVDSGDLKYAEYGGDKWQTEVVDNGGNVGQYTSIEVSDEGPHISYFSEDGDLKYTYRDNGGWKGGFIEGSASISGDASLKIYGNNIYTAYSGDGNRLTYAIKDGEDWKKKIVDNSSFVSVDSSLDIGKYGRAYISYPNMNANNLKYLTYYTVPSRPTGLRALSGDESVKLEWTEPDNNGGKPTEEHYLYRIGPDGDKRRIASLDSPQTTYLDSSVDNGKVYRYFVTALNVIGESESSNEIEVKPPSDKPLGAGELEEVEGVTTTTTLESEDKTEKTVSRDIFEDEKSKNWGIYPYIVFIILIIVLIVFIWRKKT